MTLHLRGTLPKKSATLYSFIGVAGFIFIWQLIRVFNLIPHAILPSFMDVIYALPELHFNDFLVRNLWFSTKINIGGYLVAILLSFPLGYVLGLFIIPKALCSKLLDAIRYIPFTAVTGIFIAWFGLGTDMKTYFLGCAIAVYLLPTVVERVVNFDEIYVQTAKTMGASKWQIIRDVFIRGVIPILYNDLRVLTAISWTYIVVAEMINAEGGVGKLIFLSTRENRLDKVFAEIIIIMLFGMLQDSLFAWGDRKMFKHKYC